MTLSRKSWENYIMTLRDVNEEAATKLVQYLNTHDVFSGTADAITVNSEELKPFIDYAYAIVSKYGEAAASLAAEMYDLTAEFEGVILPPAELAPLAKYGDIAKAINGTIKVSQNYDEIASAATRWVKMAASDTTLHNAQRDGAQFAWIPSGDTCAFCLTLASRGWQYMSKNAMKNGHAEHIHSNCDCQYTIRHDSKTTVAGYDPDEYLRMYRNAEGSTPQERINSMRRAAYERRDNNSFGRTSENAVAGRDAIRNTYTEVFFNPENDYSIHLAGYSDGVNSGLSDAARRVAEDGSITRNEHLHLIDLENGNDVYGEEGDHISVGGERFWEFIENHPQGKYAFVHNHNTDGMFSETDMNTLLTTEQIPVMIAVRNDSVKYIAIREGNALHNVIFDDLYSEELAELNAKVRDGIITQAERTLQREAIIVENLLRDFTQGKGLVEYDGRKE